MHRAGPLAQRASDCLLATCGKTAQVAFYGFYFGAAYSLLAEGGYRARPLRAALRTAAAEGGKTAAVLVAGIGLGCTVCAVATGGNATEVTELSLRGAPLPALWAAAWGGMLAHLQLEARGVGVGGGGGGAAAAAAGGDGTAAAGEWTRRLLRGPPWARAGAAALFASAVAAAASQMR